VVVIVLVLVAVAGAFLTGGWQLTFSGLAKAGELISDVWLRLILGFALGGLIQVLVPRDLILKWLGPSSGLKGIFIGAYTGIIFSAPPYVSLPIVASLFRAGAGAGPIIALLTGQQLLGLQQLLVWQIPFFGLGIPLSRYIVSLFVAPLVGIAGGALYKVVARNIKPNDESTGESDILPPNTETGTEAQPPTEKEK
jgi:uncharacterized membrane protein YraQ (UPF0718 family)